MSGRHRIIAGQVALGKARGKDLADALDKGLNQAEKASTYQKAAI